jgi:hypothetical protein
MRIYSTGVPIWEHAVILEFSLVPKWDGCQFGVYGALAQFRYGPQVLELGVAPITFCTQFWNSAPPNGCSAHLKHQCPSSRTGPVTIWGATYMLHQKYYCLLKIAMVMKMALFLKELRYYGFVFKGYFILKYNFISQI